MGDPGSDPGGPVVLIHGFGGDLNSWLFTQPVLAERVKVDLTLPGRRVPGLRSTCSSPVGRRSSQPVRRRSVAERLLTVHPLRAADALQLAAALVWSEGSPDQRAFACLDDRFREAARKEGFTLQPSD